MGRSRYKEKILEKLRVLHAEEKLLYELLNECKEEEKEDGNSSSVNR